MIKMLAVDFVMIPVGLLQDIGIECSKFRHKFLMLEDSMIKVPMLEIYVACLNML